MEPASLQRWFPAAECVILPTLLHTDRPSHPGSPASNARSFIIPPPTPATAASLTAEDDSDKVMAASLGHQPPAAPTAGVEGITVAPREEPDVKLYPL